MSSTTVPPFSRHRGDSSQALSTVPSKCIRRLGSADARGLSTATRLRFELEHRCIEFEREKQVPIYYRDRLLRVHRVDLVVMNEVLVELKAVDRLALVHQAQVLSYLACDPAFESGCS